MSDPGPRRTGRPNPASRAGQTLRRKASTAGAKAAAIRVAAVLLGFGVLIGGGSLLPDAGAGTWLFQSAVSEADSTSNKPVRVPVDEATLACPESTYEADESSTEISAIAAPSSLVQAHTADEAEQEGSLVLTELGEEKVNKTAKRRDDLARFGIDEPDQKPFLAVGRGPLAPGATAGQTTRSESGQMRGLAEAQCISPGSDFWFVGAGSQVGRRPRLYLTNADDTEAQVDIVMYDENGAVDNDTTRGLIVEPRAQRIVELDKYVPESEHLAVRVTAARGRVVGALRDERVDPQGRPIGVDWIPSAVAPAERLVVPGLPPGSGRRTLTVVAPSDHSAVVDIRVFGKSGPFLPAENGRLEVPANTVRQVSLEDATAEQAAAIQITSDVPVTAGVRTEQGSDPTRDASFTAAAEPLTGPAVVPSTYNGDDQDGTLVLSAIGSGNVSAEIVVIGSGGRAEPPRTVTVASGTTKAYPIPKPKRDSRYTVVVTPSEPGKLLGARVQVDSSAAGYDEGALISTWPLVTGPITTVRPVAAPDLGATLTR